MKAIKVLKNNLSTDITTIPEIVKDNHFPSLDGLRAVAIMLVILYHFGANHFLRPFHILINGDTGVNLFFVISGFLITTLLLKGKMAHGQISLKRFYLRRALRVIPAAYLFLLVMILLNAIYKFGITGRSFAAAFLFYKNFPYQEEPFLGHFWTLAAEAQFYLFFPLLLSLNTKWYTVVLSVIVIAVPFISILGFYHVHFLFGNAFIKQATQIIMYSFWKGPFIILIGSLAAVLLFKGIIDIKNNKYSYLLSFLLLATALMISSKSFVFYTPYVCELGSAVLFVWVILLNLDKPNFLSTILQSRVMTKIGVLSYSLYLWQQPFIGNHVWQPWLSAFAGCSQATLLAVKLLMVFALALASYYLVERMFLKLKLKYE
ncbi:peptidoglycan/LPS O-acetylase OafA/YrhL [Mucilaginibacter frigoritolerans]|uniref:Peptidoglycan/LPS O-acetylase OafA/YrhL n=1 Tax=Mucilaginibacter frigoritolerans TaxID=652788 RepID=A0A562TZ04_9SPHI|nr:acyltransferase [Mucilaginibacter frigoritolerans]TWI98852.1 peptidoglycan/LPS O-acetylase OafA/YrhL [Mucilaginibacter frigoritolerans]